MDQRALISCIFWIFSFMSAVNSASPAILVENSTEASDGEVLSISESFCVEFMGAYARKNNAGIVCCGNQTLYLPVELTDNWETNILLDNCTIESTHINDADLPTAFWSVSNCLLQKTPAFSGNKHTFDGYFNFVTNNYPDDVKKEIKSATDACKAEAEKAQTDTKKLQKYTECLHKSEKQVCHKPYQTSLHEELKKKLDDTKYACPGLEGVYGADRVDFCCKNESLPFNFLEFFVHFPSYDYNEKMEKAYNCSRSFIKGQLDLDPALKKQLESLETEDESGNMTEAEATYSDAARRLHHCTVGCNVFETNFISSKQLSLQYEKSVDKMLRVFGSKIRNDLKSIVVGRKSVAVFHFLNSSLTHDEYTKKFESADEMTRIHLYCNFYSNVVAEVDRALHEYCFDKEYADTWLNSHWKQIIE